jgi:hypothetical protein
MAAKKKGAKKKKGTKKGTSPVVPLLLVGAGITAGVGAYFYFRPGGAGGAGGAGAGPPSRVPQSKPFQDMSRRQIAAQTAAHQEQWRAGGGLEAYCAKNPNHPRCQNLGYVNFGYSSDKMIKQYAKNVSDVTSGATTSIRDYLAEREARERKQAKQEKGATERLRREEQERQDRADRQEKALLVFLAIAGISIPVILFKKRGK